MKIIITERQLNELMSLENYDAVTFISNNLINELDGLSKIVFDDNGKVRSDFPQEKELINILTEVIVNSIIEFYELGDNEENRKKINSLFYFYFNIIQRLQLHIKNKKRDFQTIVYFYGSREKNYNDESIKPIIGKLVELLEKKYPEWVERSEFKKSELLPYKKTPFEGDELSRGIYDWNTTFETLEKLFYDFLFENLEHSEYEKYKTIIDSNLDKLKEYVGKNNYKTHISYVKMYPNVMISTLEQDKVYDKEYLLNYIESLRDIGIEKKLFDRDFINFLFMFNKFIGG
jgi:hypothetical protein